MQTDLISVYISMTDRPCSRPKPDCLKPPNGMAGSTKLWQFTHTVPALIFGTMRLMVAQPALPADEQARRAFQEAGDVRRRRRLSSDGSVRKSVHGSLQETNSAGNRAGRGLYPERSQPA